MGQPLTDGSGVVPRPEQHCVRLAFRGAQPPTCTVIRGLVGCGGCFLAISSSMEETSQHEASKAPALKRGRAWRLQKKREAARDRKRRQRERNSLKQLLQPLTAVPLRRCRPLDHQSLLL